jgi:tetratricopeptide (TPR) repeat protein
MLFACAHQARPPPLSGWQELRSEHFRVQTDLSPSAARGTLERLETLRSALQTAWAVPEDTSDTADVVVLGETAELLTFTDWLGLSSVSGSRPLIVTAALSTGALEDPLPNTTVLAHELTHVLVRWRMPSVAPWYEEGLATLLGTMQIRDGPLASFGGRGVHAPVVSAGKLFAGSVPPSDPSGTAMPSIPPQESLDPDSRSDEVLGLDALDQLPWQFATPEAGRVAYRSARLWVQALRLREPGRVRTLEQALGGGDSWRQGWAAARRGLDVTTLEKLVRSWTNQVFLPAEEHPFTPPTIHPAARAMAAWEARCVRAELWLLGGAPEQRADRVARARAELESAAREAPGEALPRVALARLEPEPGARLAAAEATARAYPDSPEAAVFLAATLRDDPGERPGRVEAVARALKLAPSDPDALSASAVEQARTGQAQAALQTIGSAVSRAPWSPVVLRVQANLLAAAGRCEDALEAARRARGVLPHQAPPELVEAVQRDLELIRGKCTHAEAVFIARALVLGAIGRCDEAVGAAQRALDLLPDNPPALQVRILADERDRIGRACRSLPDP